MTDPKEFKWHLDPSDTQKFSIKPLQIKATCDLFGTGAMLIEFREDIRIPNRWIRFWSTVFFNSKWTIIIKDNEPTTAS